MKAFTVQYKVYRVERVETVLAENEAGVEAALAAKSVHDFKLNDSSSRIIFITEVPLEKLPVSKLSVAELMLIVKVAMREQIRAFSGSGS